MVCAVVARQELNRALKPPECRPCSCSLFARWAMARPQSRRQTPEGTDHGGHDGQAQQHPPYEVSGGSVFILPWDRAMMVCCHTELPRARVMLAQTCSQTNHDEALLCSAEDSTALPGVNQQDGEDLMSGD